MYKSVIMTEKKNAAMDILDALGLSDVRRVGDSGFIHGMAAEDEEVVLVWSNGHCLELPEPEQIDPDYKKWQLKDLPLPLLSDMELIIKPEKKGLVYDIRRELVDADDIVNAGDAGREGELIQRWILNYVLEGKQRLKKPSRLWLQSMNKSAIQKAFENLLGASPEDVKTLDQLYDSGRARAIMDKYIGYNYSRLISLTQTDGLTVNYGRCKSPLVHAIVERDMEIENFVPVPFRYLEVVLEKKAANVFCSGAENTEDQEFKAVLVGDDKNRINFTEDRYEELERIYRSLKDRSTVLSIETKSKCITPPHPYDTLQIQKLMASRFGYSADQTLDILERLYDTYKILSYPRTESRYYTTDLKGDLQLVLQALDFDEFAPMATGARNGSIADKYFNDKKVADHHALTPVLPEKGTLQEVYQRLTEEERLVYRQILLNFIALHYPNYEYEAVEVLTENNGHHFLSKGRTVKCIGFRKVYAEEKRGPNADEDAPGEKDAQSLPSLRPGELVVVSSAVVRNDKTRPKSRFTTATLLDYMQVHNIGTGATRDTIIKELTMCKGRNLSPSVRRDGKYFISTQLGRDMDDCIPDKLKSIEFLKKMEKAISDIAEGKLQLREFLYDIDREFKEDLEEMKAHPTVKLSERTYGRKLREDMHCPVCGSPLTDVGWGFSCSRWTKNGSGCRFSIGRKQFNKKLSEKVIKQLLENGESRDVIRHLKGKSGKPFDAKLVLEILKEGKTRVRPEFQNEGR